MPLWCPSRRAASGFAVLGWLTLACGGTEPPAPTEIALTPGSIALTSLGQTLQLAAAVTDQRGDPISADVTWTSSNESVVTVSPTGLVTAQGAGDAQVTATAGAARASATASVVQEVAALRRLSGDAQAGVAGRTLGLPLVVAAEDALGNPIGGLGVRFTVSQGGGQVDPADVTTDGEGKASVSYTLGNTPGAAQQVTVSTTGSAVVATFSATATTEPAAVGAFAGNGQSARSGLAVPIPPAVRVVDAAAQPVPGVAVRFQVGRGGGSVTGGIKLTNANGVAAADQWKLGPGGVNTLDATVDAETLAGEPVTFAATTTPAAGFDIVIRYSGTPTPSQVLSFAEAEVRWEAIVTGDLSDGSVNVPAETCPGTPAINETVDDLLIFAAFKTIDGPGNVLAQAGPCLIRDNNGNGQFEIGDLTGVGIMNFDVADLDFVEQSGVLSAVALHEMGHVLGIGSLWGDEGLLADPSLPPNNGTDPHFTGDQAVAAFDGVGGTTYAGGEKVPVEDTGGPGTADGHWRESVFGNELMTGFIDLVSNPLSAVTISSLADQGYQVDAGQADAYTLAAAVRIAGGRPPVMLHGDVLRLPVRRYRPGRR